MSLVESTPLDELASRSPLRTAAGNRWVRFAVRRLVGLVGVVLLLVVIVFALLRLTPGDPAVAATGGDVTTSPAQLEAVRKQLGLTDSLPAQFVHYVNQLAHGDLGRSFATQQPVKQVISQRIGSSLQLALGGLVVALVIGVTLGLVAGGLTRDGRHRRFEVVFTAVTSAAANIPPYVLATGLIFIFAITLTLLPVSGDGGGNQLVLPVLAVGLPPAAVFARVVRIEMLNVLAQDYIRTARSKRIPTLRLFVRHALPNVLSAVLPIAGITFGTIIASSVVVEAVFARAGLGTALVTAVLARDYPTVQGITLVLGLLVVLVNALVDVLIVFVNPRSLASDS
jgi:peptide/nickel transport system permease protein